MFEFQVTVHCVGV